MSKASSAVSSTSNLVSSVFSMVEKLIGFLLQGWVLACLGAIALAAIFLDPASKSAASQFGLSLYETGKDLASFGMTVADWLLSYVR